MPGRYESHYLRAVDPARPRAAWIRHTRTRRLARSGPGAVVRRLGRRGRPAVRGQAAAAVRRAARTGARVEVRPFPDRDGRGWRTFACPGERPLGDAVGWAQPAIASSARSTSCSLVLRWNEKRVSPLRSVAHHARRRAAARWRRRRARRRRSPSRRRQPEAGAEAVREPDVVRVDGVDADVLEQRQRRRRAHPAQPRGRDVEAAGAAGQPQRGAVVGLDGIVAGVPAREVRLQPLARPPGGWRRTPCRAGSSATCSRSRPDSRSGPRRAAASRPPAWRRRT